MSEASRPKMIPNGRFSQGSELFGRWRDDVNSGQGPVLYRHGIPYPEIGPGLVTLIGGAPAAGKTAFVGVISVEMLRFNPDLRVLMANCEMSPESLLNRQLARLSGIDAEVIRHRRFAPEHEERLAAGLATLEAVIDRMAFMSAPYDIANVAASVDDFGANVVFIDYVQRFATPNDDSEARQRVNRVMDYLRRFANAGLAVIVVSAVGRTRDMAGRSSYSGDGLSLASFRETSELEYGADDALILTSVGGDGSNMVRLSHLKARHGRQVTQTFEFNRSVQSFTLASSDDTSFSVASAPAASEIREVTRVSASDELRRLWESSKDAGDHGAHPISPLGVQH